MGCSKADVWNFAGYFQAYRYFVRMTVRLLAREDGGLFHTADRFGVTKLTSK